MKLRLLPVALFLVFAASACGPQSLLTDGTYLAGAAAPLASATLVIDTSAKTATLTLDGEGEAHQLQLEAIAAEDWERGCPGNYSSVAVETFEVTPDPLELGTTSLSGVRLVAGCKLDTAGNLAADPDTVSLKGTGPGDVEFLNVFFRD